MADSSSATAQDSNQLTRTSRVRAMFDRIARRYDLLNSIVSLGMDRGWRKRAVRELRLAPGGTVLDLACGTSALAKPLGAAGLSTVGLDISEQMMRHSAAGQAHILGNCLELPVKDGACQGVICAFSLRHFTSMPPLLDEAARVLAPNGRLALLELDIPKPAVLRLGHQLYCRTFIPLAGRLLAEKSAYDYLNESLEMLPPHEVLEQNLTQAGFAEVRRFKLSAGIAQLVTATRCDSQIPNAKVTP